ncbi:hypothetical protein KUTeg_014850 [Tegillarca granosa]|uniref:Mutator-like transposase domain-containing protein n=1 Tax=Tegillarca granosa TaxID=220873 RepID=A0ABQ9EQR8_TEGGR|nr:hypothetical protein KUTeg_014850 [Tegillarca granosa]
MPLDNNQHYDVNVRSVWGSMVTGGRVSHLHELMATLNSPSMSQPTYSSIEQEIGDLLGDVVQEDLLAAGAVICDGGWSKRSHKHTYNALGGGVAVIIVAETQKPLYIGVCYPIKINETDKQAAVRLLQRDIHDIHNSVHQVIIADVQIFVKADSRQILLFLQMLILNLMVITKCPRMKIYQIFLRKFPTYGQKQHHFSYRKIHVATNISENLTSMIMRDVGVLLDRVAK